MKGRTLRRRQLGPWDCYLDFEPLSWLFGLEVLESIDFGLACGLHLHFGPLRLSAYHRLERTSEGWNP